MIHYYKCKNFYSIKDEVTVNFEVDKKAPKSNTYSSSGDGRASLIEAIVGPNASGKTNVIKALAFTRHLIVSDQGADEDIPVVTFRQDDTPTELSVKFSVEDRTYIYDFTLTRKRILAEKLREWSMSEQRTTYKTLFSRTWNEDTGTYSLTDRVFGLPKTAKLHRNASVVSHAWRINESDPTASAILLYWKRSVVSNVWEGGNLDDQHLHGDHLTKAAMSFFYDNPPMQDAARDILRKIDVGFHDFEREELKLEKRVTWGIKHKYSGSEFSVPLRYESSGTKRVVAMLRFIIQALNDESGGIAAIDELDVYLHPDIVEALVKLFTSPQTNPNKAQLLFSSHSHQLLAELDKQQITLIEKNGEGKTEVWRLDEVTGVRADENYYTKYIAGAYKAKPKLT